MKKIFTIAIIFILSNQLFSQLNMGFDITHTQSSFLESNLTTFGSTKQISYLNYNIKNFIIESYFADDLITSITENHRYYNEYYEFGLLFGAVNKYANGKYFNTSIGLYERIFTKKQDLINDFGKKIGITGKLQFGFEMKRGLYTGFTYRFFQDIYNLSEEQNQLFLNQSSFCFTFEFSLNEVYNKIINRKAKKKVN